MPRRDPLVYRGPVVDLDLRGAPMREALILLADAAGLNLVVGEGVEGRITVRLRRVRAGRAMHALAAAHRVQLEIEGNLVVATAAPP